MASSFNEGQKVKDSYIGQNDDSSQLNNCFPKFPRDLLYSSKYGMFLMQEILRYIKDLIMLENKR